MPVAEAPTRSACSRTKLACLYEAYPKPVAAVPPMPRPHRLLVVLPSWVGDAVMATPSLRLLRAMLPGAFIGALVRPGLDELLAGLETIDELHVERSVGVMGPKRVAGAVRPRRYDAALLLTNSFSSALIARLAGVPTRIGYDRDGRGFLLTGRLTPVKRRDLEPFSRSPSDPGGWAPVPACVYYWHAASALLAAAGCDPAPASRMAELLVGLAEVGNARGLGSAVLHFEGDGGVGAGLDGGVECLPVFAGEAAEGGGLLGGSQRGGGEQGGQGQGGKACRDGENGVAVHGWGNTTGGFFPAREFTDGMLTMYLKRMPPHGRNLQLWDGQKGRSQGLFAA